MKNDYSLNILKTNFINSIIGKMDFDKFEKFVNFINNNYFYIKDNKK